MVETRTSRQTSVNSLVQRGFHRCAGDCANHYVRLTNFREHAFICQTGASLFEIRYFKETINVG